MARIFDQLSASFALAKAGLIATLRSPTSVVFSLLFPIIFIVVFGSMVNTTVVHLKVAFAPECDTGNIVYKSILKIENIQVDSSLSATGATDALKKGRLTAIINIKKDTTNTPFPHYNILITSSASSGGASSVLENILNTTIASVNNKIFPANASIASLANNELPGRKYRQIDFILPGQLGFSLLMAGVFGSAFLLFSLRKNLVLKRLSVAPVNRFYLILGEMLSRLFFHMLSFIIIIALGYFAFSFTLTNGVYTFLEMFIFSLLGLLIFMGIGFIISGLVHHESSIAPIANTVTLPQILLCGLFFPIANYPHWLQSFCNILPLTFFVDGLRKIAFEGTHLWQMPLQVAGLSIWALIIGFACVRSFKWE